MCPLNLRQLITGGLIFLAIAAGYGEAVKAETTTQFFARVDTNRMTLHRDSAIVFFGGVAAPVGRFLLIRKESAMCAILLKGFRRAGDAKPPTAFSTGAEHRFAEYDWYFQSDGSGDFKRGNTRRGHDSLEDGPLYGIGRLNFFGSGNINISCGPIELTWEYPDVISFFPSITHDSI